jgi:hypothetical protein
MDGYRMVRVPNIQLRPLMYRKVCLLLLSIVLCCPAFAGSAHRSSVKPSKSATAEKSTSAQVRGYTKKDGTYVAPYSRGEPGTRVTAGTSASGYKVPRPYSNRHVAEGYTAHSSHGRIKRSAAAKDAFKRQQPCPANGKSSGSCPGYVIDHVNPLECGGADAPSNMQWQTLAEGKAKDKTERYCRK